MAKSIKKTKVKSGEVKMEIKKIPEDVVEVCSSLGELGKDARFTDLGNGKFSVLPSQLKDNEKIVDKNGRNFVELLAPDQATYLL